MNCPQALRLRPRIALAAVSAVVIMIASWYAITALPKYVLEHLDEVYTYQLIGGYHISGHKHIDSASISYGTDGIVVGSSSLSLPAAVFVTKYAVVDKYIVGSTFDKSTGSTLFFVIDAETKTINRDLSLPEYSVTLKSLGIGESIEYAVPPRR